MVPQTDIRLPRTDIFDQYQSKNEIPVYGSSYLSVKINGFSS